MSKSVVKAMRWIAVFCTTVIASVTLSLCEKEHRLVRIPQGPVLGYKEQEDDVFAFYGVPYASAPTGQNRFKAPLPPPTWLTTFEAVEKYIACPQKLIPEYMPQNIIFQENCLVANIFVTDTNETNNSVVVYVHGGAFQMGYGNYLTAKKLQRNKKLIIVTFNYRLGPHGFLCLGTDDVPGNAGMKDQVALLRWVKNNIASFGGNPDDVTITGYSAGSAAVDLLMLSPAAKGLFNKVVPESGSNLAAFSVQIDPIKNAKDYAKRLSFQHVNDIYAVEQFYKTISFETLFTDGFMDRKDSTFVFSPCVERKTSEEPFLEDSPYNIINNGHYEKVPMLYGFANMEGLLRVPYFESWKDSMNEKFSDFLPPDLQFEDESEKENVANRIKKFYFGNEPITRDSILPYIDYFSDTLFAYSTLRAVELHVKAGHNNIFLYEYEYTDENDPTNSSQVPYTESVYGANHCAQTMAIFDGLGVLHTNEDDISEEHKEVKALMRELWANFIISGTPVPAGTSLPEWPPVGEGGAPHMSLDRALELRGALLERRARFWDDIYQRHYRAPQPPPPPARHTEL